MTDLEYAIQLAIDTARYESIPHGLAAWKAEQATGVDRSDIARGMAKRAKAKLDAEKGRDRWSPYRWKRRSWGNNGEDVPE